MTDIQQDPTRPVRGPAARLRRFALRHINLTLGGIMLLIVVLISLLAPLLATHDPLTVNPQLRLKGPSADHIFGTDMHGRDLWSRVVYGGRVSLLVGVSVAVLTSIIGTMVGLLSGFYRALDGVLMRITDAIMSIPPIMLAIALMALWQASVQNVILAITLAEIPRMARLVRSSVLSLREQLYIEAMVAAGAGSMRIILRHILPNAMAPIVVQATFVCAAAMLIEAAMSFIGAGVPPTTPSWGNVLAEGRTLWQIRPEMVFAPAIALSLTVLAMNLLGDGLSDSLDPRNKPRH